MANALEQWFNAKPNNTNPPKGIAADNSELARIKRKERKEARRDEKDLMAKHEEERQHQIYLGASARRFREVGLSWKTCLVSNPSRDKIVRQQWRELLRELVVANEDERPSLLFAFSYGLGLSEENPNGFPAHSQYPLDVYQQMPDGKRFSRASRIFIEVVADISGINEREKDVFRESLNSRKDLKIKYVGLRQTFPGIAHLMVRQSERSPQSPRLS